jgi:pimeloyl-ACP methyl ester carboxylesterase
VEEIMRTVLRWLATIAVALPVTVVGPGLPARAAGGPPAIDWQPCPTEPAVQCGSVRVPLDWSRPRGSAIELAVYRRPASDPAARIGTFVTSYPVAPALALIQPEFFPAEIGRRFDLVSWDPRGVGANPIRCSAALLEELWLAVGEAAGLPTSQSDLDEIERAGGRLFADCRERSGPLFDHAHSVADARDMEAIRAALGEDKLTYYGGSWATLTGQMYAELFPHRIRAVVLDSVVDHSLDTRGYWEAQATGTQIAFDEFVAWSDRTPASALYGRDVRALWRDLLARAGRRELASASDPPRPAIPEELVNLAFDGLNEARWVELTHLLAAIDAGEPVPAPPPILDEGHASVVDVPILRWCADFRMPVRDYAEFARLLRRTERLTPDMRFTAEPVLGSLLCRGAPRPPGNPEHRLEVRHAANPLLLVNSVLDPNTSYRMATNVADQLGRDGALLSYDGPGHGLYHQRPVRGSECVDDAINRYLLTQTLPRPGTHCPAVEPG